MNTTFICNDSINSERMNIKFFRYLGIPRNSFSRIFSYQFNMLFRQFCSWVTFSKMNSFFIHRVLHIVFSSSKKQMIWINTSSNITSMTKIKSLWKFFFTYIFPHEAMNSPIFTFKSKLSIPTFKDSSFPNPTRMSFSDIFVKSIYCVSGSFHNVNNSMYGLHIRSD